MDCSGLPCRLLPRPSGGRDDVILSSRRYTAVTSPTICWHSQKPGARTWTNAGYGSFNTSRQVGGGLAVAVFGALLADGATFLQGTRTSLFIADAFALAAALASGMLQPSRTD